MKEMEVIVKQIFSKFWNCWFTWSNIVEKWEFWCPQMIVFSLLYEAVYDGILRYFGVWKPVWHFRENAAIAAELAQHCIWYWVPAILFFVVIIASMINEKRLNHIQSKSEKRVLEPMIEPGSDVFYK